MRRPHRWLRIGPGLLLAIVASAFLWQQSRPAPGGVVVGPIERGHAAEPSALDRPVPPPPAPDPAWLATQHAALGLSAAQTTRLNALTLRWDRETRELRQELDRASAQFDRSTPAGRGVTLDALRERAAPVSALSRRLADARRTWWSEAAPILTPEQRQQAEKTWTARFLWEAP